MGVRGQARRMGQGPHVWKSGLTIMWEGAWTAWKGKGENRRDARVGSRPEAMGAQKRLGKEMRNTEDSYSVGPPGWVEGQARGKRTKGALKALRLGIRMDDGGGEKTAWKWQETMSFVL